jgi:hypothetical protein
VSLRSAGCIVAFALSLLGGPLVADAQLSTKVYRIGWLGQVGASGSNLAAERADSDSDRSAKVLRRTLKQ